MLAWAWTYEGRRIINELVPIHFSRAFASFIVHRCPLSWGTPLPFDVSFVLAVATLMAVALGDSERIDFGGVNERVDGASCATSPRERPSRYNVVSNPVLQMAPSVFKE